MGATAELGKPARDRRQPTLFQAGYQPITITSEYAEIIYFLRNGNLYRRVLLVAPERQSAIVPTINNPASFIVTSDGTRHKPAIPPGSAWEAPPR